MNELQRELSEIEQQILVEQEKGASRNINLLADMEQKRSDLALKLEELTKQQKVQEAVESDVQATQTAIIDAFASIEVEGQTYSLRDFTINEQFAQVLSVWFQLKAGEIAQQYSNQAQSYKQENDELKAVIEEKDASLSFLRADNDRLGLLNADLQAKRDAASEQIEEQEQTIKRLNDDISKLRDNVDKPKQTNLNNNLAELMKAALQSLPAITNLRWENPMNRKFYLAEDAKTGETIRFNYLELGKYREVTPDEASQFREEAEQIQTDIAANLPLVHESSIEPPALPSEAENIGLGMASNDTIAQMASTELTIEERLTALEAAVFGKVEQVA